MTNFIITKVVGNLNFSYFLLLMWEFLGLESECEGSIYWPNNKIIDCKTGFIIFGSPVNFFLMLNYFLILKLINN